MDVNLGQWGFYKEQEPSGLRSLGVLGKLVEDLNEASSSFLGWLSLP